MVRPYWAGLSLLVLVFGIGAYVYVHDGKPERIRIIRFWINGELIQMPLTALQGLSQMEALTQLEIRDQEGKVHWKGMLTDLEIVIQDTVWGEVKSSP